MNHLSDFSERDWEMAPRYESAATMPGVIALEFDTLKSMADNEAAIGAFRKSNDGTFGKAPLYVDGLPAAFYSLETKSFDEFTPNHNTADDEMLVVVDGMLRVVVNDGTERPQADDLRNTFHKGRVLRLKNEAISMQAVGIFEPANALALALFRDDNPKIQYDL